MNKATPEPRTTRDEWQIALLGLMFLLLGTVLSLASHRSSRRTIALPPAPPRPRHYPDFPDGVTEPPQWLRQDVPLDLDRGFVVIPREINAAPLYLDAFFEFAPELGYCFPSEEAEMRAPVARLRSRWIADVYDRWEANPEEVAAVEIDELVKALDDGFQKLKVASKRPNCVFECGVGYAAVIGHVSDARVVVKALLLRAWRSLELGDLDAAIDDYETILDISSALRNRSYLITLISNLKIQTLGFEKCLMPILSHSQIKMRHLQRLLDLLVEHDLDADELAAQALTCEYVSLQVTLRDAENSLGWFGEEHGDNVDLAMERILEYLERRTPTEATQDRQAIDNTYQKAILLPDNRQRADWIRTNWDTFGLPESLASPLNLLAVVEACQHLKSLSEVSKQFVAIGSAMLHGKETEDLKEVYRIAGLTEPPWDPYADAPFRMHRVNGKHVIYSVGPDGDDDGGRKAQANLSDFYEWFGRDIPDGDWIFSLPIRWGKLPPQD